MMHYWIGNTGHLAILTSFVTALVATFAYTKASQNTLEASSWQRFARYSFYAHAAAVVTVVASLYWIIYNHYYEYHYAWDNSSRSLPAYYVISSFWQDQEGSFLLWIFWLAVIGISLITYFKSNKLEQKVRFEAPTMAIFGLVQAFLCSMILGVVIPGLEMKIGSSPFLLLREAHPEWPVWALKPEFIPEDGNGLNPLLQNPWMVIHPPTLFLGYALTLVPFAFCIAGLWRKEYKSWIKPALPWTALGALILGVGIMMGAIWAYETLNFGGYWNWDPVENGIYVPWLVLVAALHTLIIYQNNKSTLKISSILVIAQFILVLYATFMTRSGILGNASVHSFTDLGLSGQLLIYLLTFTVLSIGLLSWRWKDMPSSDKEISTYSREFWIFCGATVICLAAFQVITTTSIPVYNALLANFGIKSNIALPADQVKHYTDFQLWFFVVIVILNAIGQYFWWGKVKVEKTEPKVEGNVLVTRGMSFNLGAWEVFSTPLMITFVLTAILIVAMQVGAWNWIYLVLLLAAIFSLVVNFSTILTVLKGKWQLSGGAVSHIGIALMLIGVLFSSGYSKVVSQNRSGLIIFNDKKVDTKENVDNQLLWMNQPQQLDKYLVTYKGQFLEAREVPGYLPKSWVELIENDFHAVAKQDIVKDGKTYYKKGDTLAVFPENTYYEVEYRQQDGKIFSLFPRVQVNPRMGNAVSPSIRHELTRDVYTHITDAPMPNQEKQWSATETQTVSVGDTLILNDYVAMFRGVEPVREVDGVTLGPQDAAVQADVEVFDKSGRSVAVKPIYFIKDRTVGLKAATSDELGLRLQLAQIDPKTGQFTFNINTSQRDYIVMKALEKPHINLLWIGTGLLVVGMFLSTARRFKESK
ncbi:cytochrome C biogenesis protein [Siphonobacter sp. SORGH_AS_0500]|nr:cytochrome C biogenesis protein [Siphonobacter sp. SORGH_AS_0500]